MWAPFWLVIWLFNKTRKVKTVTTFH